MKKMMSYEALGIGLAMFSMFFGAGNIIFPLAVGQYAGDGNLYAMLGLILTAAILPLVGVIAMILYDGDTQKFFGRIGRIPGLLLAFAIIALLGPLGSTPRCIALSYTTLKSSFPDLSSIYFSAASCVLIFLFTIRKNSILKLLGWVLTPFLILSLASIICIGLMTPYEPHSIDESGLNLFLHGLKEGYNTMDLLAAFFFSSSILTILKSRTDKSENGGNYLKTALQASVIGALLLSLVYIGFSYLAAYHATSLSISSPDALLAAITMKIAGPYAGLLVCLTIALACLTTAIALISAFTDFLQKEILKESISYEAALLLSLGLTFFVATFEFTGISSFLGPILEVCYPGLIVLTFVNIAYSVIRLRASSIEIR